MRSYSVISAEGVEYDKWGNSRDAGNDAKAFSPLVLTSIAAIFANANGIKVLFSCWTSSSRYVGFVNESCVTISFVCSPRVVQRRRGVDPWMASSPDDKVDFSKSFLQSVINFCSKISKEILSLLGEKSASIPFHLSRKGKY